MPYIAVKTSAHVSEEKEPTILARISATASTIMNKPEAYMMVSLEKAAFIMGGTYAPAAFAMVKGIGGLGGSVNKELSAAISAILEEELEVAVNRTYLNFADVPGSEWGCNGSTIS